MEIQCHLRGIIGFITSAAMIRRPTGASRIDHGCVLANLFHKVEKITVGIRSIGRQALIAIVQMTNSSMKTLDGKFAEAEIGIFGSCVVLGTYC